MLCNKNKLTMYKMHNIIIIIMNQMNDQLWMQHDFRLFQMEKMVKSLSEKNGDYSLRTSVNETSFNGDGLNVDEIKVEVQKNILQSNELKNSVVDFAKTAIENDYDFDSFFENLHLI